MNSEQKSQAQSGASSDHPAPVTKRQTMMTFQHSDPEQIHQSLLAAIRSGEAAARLKRVSFYQCTQSWLWHKVLPGGLVTVGGRWGPEFRFAELSGECTHKASHVHIFKQYKSNWKSSWNKLEISKLPVTSSIESGTISVIYLCFHGLRWYGFRHMLSSFMLDLKQL